MAADGQPQVTVADDLLLATGAGIRRRAATAADRRTEVDRTAADRRMAVAVVADMDMGGNTAADSFPA